MPLSIAMVFVIVLGAAVATILFYGLARYALALTLRLFGGLPERVSNSRVWARSNAIRDRVSERYPSAVEFIRHRIDVHQPTGLALTLMTAAGVYLGALFSGLTEDILEAQGTLHTDILVNKALAPWRVEPLVGVALWVTALGSSPAVVAAVIIATGFLWSQRRSYLILPLWIACLGAIGSTSIGKFLVGRQRPESDLGIAVMTSSFPSGHATAAMAVYGFLGYAIARNLPNIRDRFEIAYWTGVLIVFIGFSRIFLGVHYLTDVIGGFLVGGFWLLVGFAFASWGAQSETAAFSTRESHSEPNDRSQ